MDEDSEERNHSGVIEDPASFFSHPEEVVRMKGLSRHDKSAILESWKLLAEEGLLSSDVNERDKAAKFLKFIEVAIRELR
jgi:hypothetical protein